MADTPGPAGDPLHPIPYGRRERLADLKQGRADGMHGIPALPAVLRRGSSPKIMTPYMETLRREFREAASLEYANVAAELADTRRKLRVLRQQITDTDELLRRMRKDIDQTPPAPPDGEPATPAPDAFEQMRRIRGRRAYELKRNEMLAEERSLMETLSRCHQQVADAEEFIEGRREVAAAVVDRMRERTMRRAGVYLSGIIDEHRHARTLNAYLQSFLSSPGDWLSFSEPADAD